MFNYTCLNPIAGVGLDLFSDDYKKVDDLAGADAALVRSAAMHLPVPVQVSTIFRLTNVLTKVSLYLIHRVQMPMV